jgi:predicted phage tail protein
MNRPIRWFRGALALCLGLALLSGPAIAGAAEAVHYTKESLPEFEAQLNGGQIQAATFNKRVRSLRLTLKNGDHKLVAYKAHESPALTAKLQAKHVAISVLAKNQAEKEVKAKPVHHKLRYIAGGVVIVVILIVGGVLIVNRRRQRD